MTTIERASKCVETLEREYPDAICSLEYKDPLQLLIATRLAAQCTDARVNIIAPKLFERFPSLDAFCEGSVEEIQELIKTCGLYKAKSKDIFAMCHMLRDEFGGVMPDTLEKLIKLPGIGRKTANLIMGDIFGKPAIVVDTHCIRLSGRIGLSKNEDPYKVEMDLKKLIPPEKSSDFCHRIVLHGRAVCSARYKKCDICCLAEFCKTFLMESKNNLRKLK